MAIALRITKIIEKGTIAKERIVFRANEDHDIGSYLVFVSSHIDKTNIDASPSKTYWFPDQKVKKDDYIVLYSREAPNTIRVNPDGTTSYFYYWGLKETLWNKEKSCPILMLINEWTMPTEDI